LYEYNIPLPKRLSGLDGLTVLHISDVHLLDGHAGPTSELGVIASFLEQSKRNIDLVFFTGDLITRSPNDLNDLAKNHLRRISRCAQHCFFVRGNHDFHGHTPEVVTRWLDEAGFPDYTNMCAELNRGSSRFSVCGIDDAYFGSPVAPAEVSPDFIITHNLDAIRANFPKDIFCVFSGHTHGGEAWLRPFGYLMKAWGYLDDVNRNIRGWSSLTQSTLSFVHPGQARYYVRHPGLWLPPGIAIHTFRRQD
jgi:predicted MPP superfamily phosphohydrolase